MKLFNPKSHNGFTLLEVIVAVSMITTGMVGIISLSLQNYQVRQTNRNILIAAQLAQEGMELVRNKRDSNWLASAPFSTGITGTFSIDYTGTITTVGGVGDPNTKLNLDGNSFYVHSVGVATPFSRFFTVNALPVGNPTYLDVSCIVGWQEKGATKNYLVRTLLYDWK